MGHIFYSKNIFYKLNGVAILNGKIVFIAPDKKLAEKANEVIKKFDENINIYQGSLNDGLEIAKREVANGANIVISRGGTGNLIKNNLQIPVVNLETNGFDILNAISKAVTYSTNIGIIGFVKLISSFDKVIEIMHNTFSIKIATAIINNEIEIIKNVKQLYEQGIKVFIGGNAVINVTNNLGYNGVLIESGNESIIEAVQHAKNLLEVQLKEKEKAEILKSIIDFAHDGILGIDKDKRITVFNPVAEKVMLKSAENIIGEIVDDVIENTRLSTVFETGETELGEIQYIGDVAIVTNRVPIIVEGEVRGVVATFQELESIQKTERKIRKKLYAKGHVAKIRFKDIIGTSDSIMQIKKKAKQFAKVDSTVMIIGETGTGKELFAQSIHNASQREDKPFVAVNCAALPENLLESELFGYVEGAFTGARKGGKIGLFELAHSGTIFLDEISEIPPMLQARLLRVIQEKEVVRIGDDRITPVDVRIIAATNRDIRKQVEIGKFREDLYYRLNVLRLRVPPLRERKEDISKLVYHFIKNKSVGLNKLVNDITFDALNKLKAYHWPGNVRQLENIIERSIVVSKGSEIDSDSILEATDNSPNFIESNSQCNKSEGLISEGVLKKVEIDIIKKVLDEVHGNKSLAAEKLGISVTTLWRRLKKIEESMNK